ncbi:hypothetical protein AQUCO_05300025v1 [Aquilegia coerulea]|uniref:Uncharacterized protein n=1 Tax=Aquilegia coerulea TaxID=218851 RepID=A0A2G5CI23_AQUCA|nr:hypothetical protein AQUCO_05300025v1 [Aquilegia coerulea]
MPRASNLLEPALQRAYLFIHSIPNTTPKFSKLHMHTVTDHRRSCCCYCFLSHLLHFCTFFSLCWLLSTSLQTLKSFPV